MWLYFSSDAKTCWKQHKEDYAIFLVTLGGLVAFFSSTLSATTSIEIPTLASLIIPICGTVIYEIGSATYSAYVYGFGNQTSLETWLYRVKTLATTNAAIGIAVVFGTYLLRLKGVYVPNVWLFIVFIASIAIRNLSVSLYVTFFHVRPTDMNWRVRLFGLGNWQHGILVIQILTAAAGIIAINAGLP